jgi:shikimate 5-dehydrogenase
MGVPACYAHLPRPVMPRVSPQKLLLGQKALVTGASSGIGRAIAHSLGDVGADVVINYVSDEDKAEALAEEIRAKGSRALALRAQRGPGIEFLEYLTPAGSRPLPADTQAADVWYWQINLCASQPAAFEISLKDSRWQLISGATDCRWPSSAGTAA